MRNPQSRLSKSFSLGLLCFILLLFLIFFIFVSWKHNTNALFFSFLGVRQTGTLLEGIDDTCTADDPVAVSQKNAGNISLLDDRVTKLEQQEVDMSNNVTSLQSNMDLLNQQLTALAQSQTDAANSAVNAANGVTANTSLTTDTSGTTTTTTTV
jgi:hypothetical protein